MFPPVEKKHHQKVSIVLRAFDSVSNKRHVLGCMINCDNSEIMTMLYDVLKLKEGKRYRGLMQGLIRKSWIRSWTSACTHVTLNRHVISDLINLVEEKEKMYFASLVVSSKIFFSFFFFFLNILVVGLDS